MRAEPADDGVASAPEIADQMQRVTQRQQQFERHLARRLAVDAPGLAAVEHLLGSGGSTPTELSRRLGVSTAAMTLVVDRLAAAGHVTREPHPTDRRKVVVRPAASTADAAQALVDPLVTGVEALVESLDRPGREAVSAFLAGVLSVYAEILDGESDGDGHPAGRTSG